MSPQTPLRLLVVSGDRLVAGTIEALLARAVPERIVQRAPSLAAALALQLSARADAILVDLAFVDASELADLTRPIAGEPSTVLGVLRQDCSLTMAEALRAGVQECILLSDLTPERLSRSLRQAIERQRLQQQLADLALRDELTGLYNRRGLFAIGEHARRQCLRNARALGIVQIDVDGLKTINDTFGHATGDQAIAATASILRCTFRESDVIARLGGDEFVAIAVDADRDAMVRVLDRLQTALVHHNARRATPFVLSFSAGFAVLTPPARPTLTDLLEQADVALYEHKRRTGTPRWMPLPVAEALRQTA
jgi:diguanylate cyclase (GGDEF)-like protein